MGGHASIGSRTWRCMSTRSAGYSWTQELTWCHVGVVSPLLDSASFTSAPLLSGSAMWWLGPAVWAQEKGGQYFLSIPAKVLGPHRPELAGATCPSAHGRMDSPNCPGCFMADFRASRVKQPLVNLKDGRWITPHTV